MDRSWLVLDRGRDKHTKRLNDPNKYLEQTSGEKLFRDPCFWISNARKGGRWERSRYRNFWLEYREGGMKFSWGKKLELRVTGIVCHPLASDCALTHTTDFLKNFTSLLCFCEKHCKVKYTPCSSFYGTVEFYVGTKINWKRKKCFFFIFYLNYCTNVV